MPRSCSAAGEGLPFPDETFRLILSHEVLEHVQDDRQAVREMVRVAAPGRADGDLRAPTAAIRSRRTGSTGAGATALATSRWSTTCRGGLRDRLAPHVRVYSAGDLERLFAGLPVRIVERTVIFGAYDNIIARRPAAGPTAAGGAAGVGAHPAALVWVYRISGWLRKDLDRRCQKLARDSTISSRTAINGLSEIVNAVFDAPSAGRSRGSPGRRLRSQRGSARRPGSGRTLPGCSAPAYRRPRSARTNTLGVSCHQLPVSCASESMRHQQAGWAAAA